MKTEINIDTTEPLGDQIGLMIHAPGMIDVTAWINPSHAERLIFDLQNFLREQYNHLDAEQRAQE